MCGESKNHVFLYRLFVCFFISLFLLQTLESLLPTQPKDPIDMEEPDVEEVNMIDFESTRGAGPLYKEAYDGDSDDDEPSGHRVGCAHQ